MKTLTHVAFPVYGMTCAGCASRLATDLNKIDSVDAQVNISIEKATLSFDGDLKHLKLAPQILDILQTKGYQTDFQQLRFHADWSNAEAVQDTINAIKKHPLVLTVTANIATHTLCVDSFASFITPASTSEIIALSPTQLSLQQGVSAAQRRSAANATVQKKQRQERFNLCLALLLSVPFWLAMIAMIFSDTHLLPPWFELALATPLQFIIGARFYKGAWLSLKQYTANMDVLVVTGTSSAYFYSLYMLINGHHHALFFESSSLVIVLIRLGKYLEFRAKQASHLAITALTELQAGEALVKKGKVFQKIAIEAVQVNDLVQIAAGDKVPVDGLIITGTSHVDEALLTGESAPIAKQPQDAVYAGTLNQDGVLLVQTTAINEQTKLSHIIHLVESAQIGKAPILQLVDKISALFVPIVLSVAAFTFFAWLYVAADAQQALLCSVAVLVIACPCALGLATPTAMVVGTGLAAQKGILIKDLNTLQLAHQLNMIAFDKTGTLTKGKVSLDKVYTLNEHCLALLLGLQQASKHPIGKAVSEYCLQHNTTAIEVTDIKIIQGQGLHGRFNNADVIAGNLALIAHFNIDLTHQLASHGIAIAAESNTLYICYKGKLIGYFEITDQLRPTSPQAIMDLHKLGVDTCLLSGDHHHAVALISKQLGIQQYHAQLTPAQKLQHLTTLKQQTVVAMVGDGINDAPALAAADVSIAMFSGSDIAKQTAGMTLMHDDPRLIAMAIKLSRATWRTIQQNLFWAFAFNILAIPAAALGYLSPTLAAMAMTCSSLMVLTNSLRLKRTQ